MITLEQDRTLTEQYNFDQIISKISTKLIDIQNDNIDQQINFALKAIGTVLKADRSYLFEFNTDNETITNTHEWVNTGIIACKDRLQNVPKVELPYFFEIMNMFLIPWGFPLPEGIVNPEAFAPGTTYTDRNGRPLRRLLAEDDLRIDPAVAYEELPLRLVEVCEYLSVRREL